jgi:cytochrome c-type biogenesis protein
MRGQVVDGCIYWQKHIEFHPSRPSYAASLLVGIIFASGWTPCVSFILGPILGMAANTATLREGVTLLLFYALGLRFPFLLIGLGLDQLWGSSSGSNLILARLKLLLVW